MIRSLKCTTLVLCVLFWFLPVSFTAIAAPDPNFVTNEQLQRSIENLKIDIATKDELEEIINQQEQPLTEAEITQQLINNQRSRISILEGNISALLSLLGIIVAILTLFGGIFVWFSRRTFSFKVEEVEKRHEEIKQLKDEVSTKLEISKELNSNLNAGLRELQDLKLNLTKSERSFVNETERIEQLRRYILYLELKVSRSENLAKFEKRIVHSKKIISDIDYWLEGTLPNPGYALLKVNEVLGENVTKDGTHETIEEKLSYYKDSLNEDESDFWEEASIPLEWRDYEDLDTEEFTDPLNDSIEDWEYTYSKIKKVHGILRAQISQNPDQFKPKK